MALMARYPDGHFELAIVDPPYGIGEDGGKQRTRGSKKTNGFKKNWDSKPPRAEYFQELFRVSKNQIIWGANHFISKIPFDSSCWLIWDKLDYGSDFADFEMAWTSFNSAAKSYRQTRQSNQNHITRPRIHPTQKPIALYKWLLKNYAKPGDKILDTHIGSGSIAIAVDSMNKVEGMDLKLTGCELDPEYYADAMKRIKTQTAQQSLFQ